MNIFNTWENQTDSEVQKEVQNNIKVLAISSVLIVANLAYIAMQVLNNA